MFEYVTLDCCDTLMSEIDRDSDLALDVLFTVRPDRRPFIY